MRSKLSKAERKEDRVQELERELTATKKKLSDKQKSIRLDTDQVTEIMNSLTDRMEWQTRTVSDEIRNKHMIVNVSTEKNKMDTFSSLLKWLLCCLFIGFGLFLFCGLFISWKTLWTGWAEKISCIIVIIIGIVCMSIGIDIHKETNRNYLIALFSALVSLVALVVTLVK